MSPNQTVVDALDRALAGLQQRNADPLAASPLFPYRDRIAALLAEGASNALVAQLFTDAGVRVSVTAVARFARQARLRRKRRAARSAPTGRSGVQRT